MAGQSYNWQMLGPMNSARRRIIEWAAPFDCRALWLANPCWYRGGLSVFDMMGRNTALLRGTISAGQWSPRGIVFDGSTNYLQVASDVSRFDLTLNWTVVFRYLRLSAATEVALFSHWAGSSSGRQLYIPAQTNGGLRLDVPYIKTIITTATGLFAAGDTRTVVASKNGTGWSLWIDDTLTAATDATAQEATTDGIGLGNTLSGTRFPFSGNFLWGAVFARALPTQLIEQLIWCPLDMWKQSSRRIFFASTVAASKPWLYLPHNARMIGAIQ